MGCNIRELAKQAGVSPATISRVLNDYPYVKPEIRKRVISVAQKNGYSLYKNCFLVIIPENANFSGYLGLILQELQKEASRRNYHLSISTELDLSFTSGAHLFDGVISLQGRLGLEKRWSRNEILPMVCINSLGKKNDNILRVASDNKQGITMALDYLKSKGHRQIAFIMMDCKQPEDSIDVQERQNVYKKWMQKHNPDIQNLICSLPIPGDTDKAKIQILKKVIQQGVTAFLAPGEGGSALLYHYLKTLNVRVPEDVSILGMEHDGLSFALSPAETTIGQNWKKIVSSAFDVLEKIQQRLPVQDLSIPFQLNERNSVADITQKE